MVREKRDINPLLLKFGVALALSFAGFLYSRLRARRIKLSPPPPSPRSSGLCFSFRFFLFPPLKSIFVVVIFIWFGGSNFQSMF
jgi:hypothetical protein